MAWQGDAGAADGRALARRAAGKHPCRPCGDLRRRRARSSQAWGDPAAVIFPRSSCKMIQALPLIESGAADAAGPDRGAAGAVLRQPSGRGAAYRHGRRAGWPTWAWPRPICAAARTEPYDQAERDRLILAARSALPVAQQLFGQACGLPDGDPAPEGRAGVCRDRPPAAARDPGGVRGGDRRDHRPATASTAARPRTSRPRVHGLARAMARFAAARDRRRCARARHAPADPRHGRPTPTWWRARAAPAPN